MAKKDQEKKKTTEPTAAAAPPPAEPQAPAASEGAPVESATAPPPTDTEPTAAAAPPPAEEESGDFDEDLALEDEGPDRLTLDELRSMGAVLAWSNDGESVDIVTRGGRRLRFPRDEELAAKLPAAALTGEAPEHPSLESGTLQPRGLRDLEEMGCILSQRHDHESGKTMVVTRGGRKLTFPGDEALAGQLTDSELDGEARSPWPRVNEKTSLLGKPIER